jgi:hypothetical protein
MFPAGRLKAAQASSNASSNLFVDLPPSGQRGLFIFAFSHKTFLTLYSYYT